MVVALSHPIEATQEYSVTLQENSLQLDLKVSTRLGISAIQAKRKLARFLIDEISLFVGPEDPILVLADKRKILWRFPIELTLGRQGWLGQVGTVDIDAQSGDLLINDELLMELKTNARLLARRIALSADA
jgi:hypothetical protein